MSTTYRFDPVGMDRFDRRGHQPAPGALVVLTPKGDRNIVGCPPQGTMGMVYVSDATTGRFYGLVLRASLTRVPK